MCGACCGEERQIKAQRSATTKFSLSRKVEDISADKKSTTKPTNTGCDDDLGAEYLTDLNIISRSEFRSSPADLLDKSWKLAVQYVSSKAVPFFVAPLAVSSKNMCVLSHYDDIVGTAGAETMIKAVRTRSFCFDPTDREATVAALAEFLR